jgi:hypothetical protein
VDTAAEKLTDTVARQKLTASETTHDNEYRIHAVTAKKRRKRVSRQKNLARPKYYFSLFFFLIWVWRVLRSVITVYFPLFFLLFFLLIKLGQQTWACLALEARQPLRCSESTEMRGTERVAGAQTISAL